MKNATIQDLIRATQMKDAGDIEEFHRLRQEALKVASRIFDDRATSYNVDHEPFDEMPYGALSLASELFKRTIRMTGLITPLRTEPLRSEDVSRLADSALDLINYASWMYAMIMVAKDKLEFEDDVEVDAPKDVSMSRREELARREVIDTTQKRQGYDRLQEGGEA